MQPAALPFDANKCSGKVHMPDAAVHCRCSNKVPTLMRTLAEEAGSTRRPAANADCRQPHDAQHLNPAAGVSPPGRSRWLTRAAAECQRRGRCGRHRAHQGHFQGLWGAAAGSGRDTVREVTPIPSDWGNEWAAASSNAGRGGCGQGRLQSCTRRRASRMLKHRSAASAMGGGACHELAG